MGAAVMAAGATEAGVTVAAISMVEVISIVEVISTAEAITAFTLRISAAGATSEEELLFPVRLRFEAREASAPR
jgi:hypothetical protein